MRGPRGQCPTIIRAVLKSASNTRGARLDQLARRRRRVLALRRNAGSIRATLPT
jgi:hypothetical protein